MTSSAREPRLSADDVRAWDIWRRAALVHARSQRHLRAVDKARRIVADGLEKAPRAALMWSGGKDSTAMTHLVCVDMGAGVDVISEKDDLDYPGEVEYVTALAEAWGCKLRIVTPGQSPVAWMDAHAHELDAGDDIHSRAAGLSKACFYALVEAATTSYDGILLGLRQEESHGRRMNAATHGACYRRKSGQWTIAPLTYWSGLDVFAYLLSRDIDPLHVYRCIAFMHAREPWRLRKSWWIPGASSRHGGTAWLRHYYPTLFRRLLQWIPSERSFT